MLVVGHSLIQLQPGWVFLWEREPIVLHVPTLGP